MFPDDFSHEQLEGTFGPFKLIALVFKIFERCKQLLCLGIVLAEANVEFFGLSRQAAFTGMIRH